MRTNKKPRATRLVEGTIVGPRPAHQIHWSSRLKTYQAPSWSWASVLGDIEAGIFCETNSEDSMIEVLEIATVPRDPKQPHGRLRSAHLKLRGTLYPLAMDPPKWPPADVPDYSRLPPTICLASLPKVKMVYWEGGQPMEMPSHIAHIHPDEPVDYVDIGKSCFLPVVKTVEVYGGGQGTSWYTFGERTMSFPNWKTRRVSADWEDGF